MLRLIPDKQVSKGSMKAKELFNSRLTDLPDCQNLCPGGEVLRKKARAYSKMMLTAQLLQLPEDPMLTHLAAA